MENTIVVKLGGVASDNLTEDFFQQIIQWQAANKKNCTCSWRRALYYKNDEISCYSCRNKKWSTCH